MNWLQIFLLLTLVLICAAPLGMYMAQVYEAKRTPLSAALGWLERAIYKALDIDPYREMNWKEYATALLVFSAVALFFFYEMLCWQGSLPFNPLGFPDVPRDLAFNAAVSFLTNTGLQSHAPEASMSLLSQTAGFTVLNFISAAISLAVMTATIRGFTRTKTEKIGNFWADMVRGTLYLLLPLAVFFALLLMPQGVVQTLTHAVNALWADPSASADESQMILTGPAASFVAIKQLSSTGGGFFNANGAHPFENPTPLSNFIETLAILLIPTAQFFMFGKMAGNMRQGWTLLVAITIVFMPLLGYGLIEEQRGNPLLPPLGIEQAQTEDQPGGNMEGKETRFGITSSVLWTSAATATSNGSVNASLDSYMPLGGAMPLLLMQFDEAVFGGVGSGLYSMLIIVIVTVFVAGLMAGRTPEYLGKKIQIFEIKMAALAMLMPHLVSLGGAALAMTLDAGKAGAFNPGAQGFVEIFYAYTSAANTNGSSMAGLMANTPFYNLSLGITMLLGRYLVILPVLALAGGMAKLNKAPFSEAVMSTTSPTFTAILAGVVLLIGFITFIPTLALGPIAEHLHLLSGLQP